MRTARENAEGDRYNDAVRLLEAGEHEQAVRAFEEIVADGNGGYPILARMNLAVARTEMGDIPGAVAEYDAVIADEAADPNLRDTARYRSALAMIDTATPNEIDVRLQPLLVSGSMYRYLAMELMVVAAIRADDLATANNWLTILSIDQNVPQTILERVQILSSIVASRPGQVAATAETPAASAAGGQFLAPAPGTATPAVPTLPGAPVFRRDQPLTPGPAAPPLLPPLDFGPPLTLPP
jgi:hypothetical protein